MDTKIETKYRKNGAIIEITTAVNNCIYRIECDDNLNSITVSCVDGSMIILPSVSNQIRIKTNINNF